MISSEASLIIRHHRLVRHSKSHVLDSIYDTEFAFPDADNATMGTLIRRGTVAAHLNFRRIPIAEFGCNTDEEASQFLMELFEKKDKCMKFFNEHKKFEAPPFSVGRGVKNLFTFFFSSLFTTCVLLCAVRACVRACSLDTVVVIGVTFSTFLFVVVCVGSWLASPSRSTSYGLTKKMDK